MFSVLSEYFGRKDLILPLKHTLRWHNSSKVIVCRKYPHYAAAVLAAMIANGHTIDNAKKSQQLKRKRLAWPFGPVYFRDILNHPFSRHVPKKLLRHNDVAFSSATNAASHNSHDAGRSGPKNQVLHEPVSTGTLQVKMTYKFPLGGDCTAALHNKKTQPNVQLQ